MLKTRGLGADAALSLVSVDALGTRTLCGLASWSL